MILHWILANGEAAWLPRRSVLMIKHYWMMHRLLTYPVDDVREMAQCELHQPMNNLSFKVAIDTALPCLPGALHHSLPIPPGYARVTVDDIVKYFADLEI